MGTQFNQNTYEPKLDNAILDGAGTNIGNATRLVGDNETALDGSMRLIFPAVFPGSKINGKLENGVILVGDLPQDCIVTGGYAVVTGKFDKAVTFDIGTEEDPKQFVDGFDASQPVRTTAKKVCLVHYNKPTQVIATIAGAGAQTTGEVAFFVELKRLSDFAYIPSN